jgi:hypothetical protein
LRWKAVFFPVKEALALKAEAEAPGGEEEIDLVA